jgi:hypothetical protein
MFPCRFGKYAVGAIFYGALLWGAGALPVWAQQQPQFTQIDREGRLTWTSENAVSYQVQKTAQLGGGAWTNVGPAVIGTGAILSIVDSNRTTTQAFYRIAATNSVPCTNTGGATCAQFVHLGAFLGDTTTTSGFPACNNHPCYPGPTRSGCGSAWFRVLLGEGSSCPASLRMYVRLEVPSGADYDLFVYRETCAGPVQSSTEGTGLTENVIAIVNDSFDGGDDSTYFFIEVRARNSAPGTWTLRMSGGTGPCF